MPFIKLDNVKKIKELVPGFDVRFVHSDNMTFAYWDIKKDALLPEHSHPHEQVANVIEGIFELTIDGVTEVVDNSNVAIIPSNKIHSGRALTDCKIMDVFYPIREDYLNSNDK